MTSAGLDRIAREALVRIERGEIASGLAVWRHAPALAPSASGFAHRAASVLLRAEGHLLPQTSVPVEVPVPPVPASRAWARAWAGDFDGAEMLASSARPGADASAATLEGALHVLRRRPTLAFPALDRATALGASEDALLFRALALVQIGLLDEAAAALAALGDGESFARRVVIAFVGARRGQGAEGFAAWAARVAQSEVHLNGLFATELPALLGADVVGRALASPAALASLLETLLDAMAGNLGPAPTLARALPDGSRSYEALSLPPTARARAVAALRSTGTLGLRAARAALDELVARHPRSVHALCYRGELQLWQGRHADALESFRAARRIEPARWADIGALAAFTLTARYARARAMARLAERRSSPVAASTLPVYRGALRRRLGAFESAIEDLRAAIDAKPSRTGARIELCLALRACDLHGEATPHAAALARDAAPLLADVASTLGIDWPREPARLVGDDVLEAALVAMRGNRSSMLTTWFDAHGEMRALETRPILQELARRALGICVEGRDA